jgi:CheY-like chemotaxis protein/HPt (histidine-containing phosphotransfer) domain-containing protein
MGYRIDIASDGVEAVHAMERKHYDIVFMDVQMPEMNGMEATRVIREHERAAVAGPNPKPRTIIIAMTASAMAGDREKCLQAGMDDYLSKPVRPEAVQRALEHWGPIVRGVPGRSPPGAARIEPPAAAPQAGAPALAEDEPIVDLDRLSELAGGDQGAIRDLENLYLTQTTSQIEELKTAVRQGIVREVERLAHKSAGASATCGMNSIVPILRELERQGREGKLSGADLLAAQAGKELERIRVFLKNRR